MQLIIEMKNIGGHKMKDVKAINLNDKFSIGGNNRLTLIAGPCTIESRELCFEVANELKRICEKLNINYIFKASFDKANRSSINSSRGLGIEKGLEILKEIKETLNIPVTTDVHESWQCEKVAEVVDILQIPAFLCRQTDLLIAAAKTGKIVNVKKGQFVAPWDMKNVVSKLEESGTDKILLCERGTSFGYNNLVVDMTGLLEMREFGYPVVFDATHSVQKPGGNGLTTGGNRKFVFPLMKAALAVGVDAIFVEVHPDPENAHSDGPNQLYLKDIEHILTSAIQINDLVKSLN